MAAFFLQYCSKDMFEDEKSRSLQDVIHSLIANQFTKMIEAMSLIDSSPGVSKFMTPRR
jgi:hypothetical protein